MDEEFKQLIKNFTERARQQGVPTEYINAFIKDRYQEFITNKELEQRNRQIDLQERELGLKYDTGSTIGLSDIEASISGGSNTGSFSDIDSGMSTSPVPTMTETGDISLPQTGAKDKYEDELRAIEEAGRGKIKNFETGEYETDINLSNQADYLREVGIPTSPELIKSISGSTLPSIYMPGYNSLLTNPNDQKPRLKM